MCSFNELVVISALCEVHLNNDNTHSEQLKVYYRKLCVSSDKTSNQ